MTTIKMDEKVLEETRWHQHIGKWWCSPGACNLTPSNADTTGAHSPYAHSQRETLATLLSEPGSDFELSLFKNSMHNVGI